MLKPLLLAGASLFPLVAISIDSIQTVQAKTVVSYTPITHHQLIAKGGRANYTNAQQQSDIKNIRQTLSTFYRGFNQSSVSTMALATETATKQERASMQGMFDRLKAVGADMSIEIQSIELVSLTDRTAVVKMAQRIRVTSPKRSGTFQSSSAIKLVKNRGQWKISDGKTAMGKVEEDR